MTDQTIEVGTWLSDERKRLGALIARLGIKADGV